MVADNDVSIDHFRWEGMQMAMRENGIIEEESSHLLLNVEENGLTHEFERLLPVFQEKTALFFASDYYALQAVMFLLAKGFSIPKDISIIGFDDLLYASLCHPGLTTIHQDLALKARCAVNGILAMIAGEQVERNVLIPVSLRERESVSEYKGVSRR